MAKNLVIVESPSKAKTIERFLGKDFVVKASMGHIRDLHKNDLSIDLDNNFEPQYEIPKDKHKVVEELKKDVLKADVIWLASDEDREGEAIAWHLKEALRLKSETTKRIVFNEITRQAIINAVGNPRDIDENLVNAQQARRVLDRIVGYQISPVLWKKVKPALSAGRVQSVAVRLIVEREEEIKQFIPKVTYKTTAIFDILASEKQTLSAVLNRSFESKDEALAFFEACKGAIFTVKAVETKPAKLSPAPPFTTSTLQQEASRKFGFPVSKTMQVAQKLYEEGKITYMRTDSVNLSSFAIGMAKNEIIALYGENYVNTRNYKTNTKGAQEAHESIRPTHMENRTIEGDASEKRLYELIWKRTLATQMADALLERTTINIEVSGRQEAFVAKGEVVLFDGYLKVYSVSVDSEDEEEDLDARLPKIAQGDKLLLLSSKAQQTYSLHPARYNEATLVKKLEDLGIGRPSTYAPTITTIQKREYIVKEDRPAQKREVNVITLSKGEIKSADIKENYGTEKAKLFPTDIGVIVTNFLVANFKDIVDYNFTAKVEKEFDSVAQGKKDWHKMIASFYTPFNKEVTVATKEAEKATGERLLGIDPESKKSVYARIGRYGAMIQIGDKDQEEKPRFASMPKDRRIDDITLAEALKLFDMPRILGKKDTEEVSVNIGRFGPYVKYGKSFVSIPKTDDVYTITLARAIELIDSKPSKEKQVLKSFDNDKIQVLSGMYGPYIKSGGANYRLPKEIVIEQLTMEQCQEIINKSPKKKTTRKPVSAKK
jgi:DNA topoisomerase I, bacterial